MSTAFYRAVRAVGTPLIQFASRPCVLHPERVPPTGPLLIVANHESVYDAMILTACTPRIVRWIGAGESFRHPLGQWFLGNMLAHPIDRSHPDPALVRTLLADLNAGEAVGIFPQGAVQDPTALQTCGWRLPDSIARLARIANVSVLPCVVLGSSKFAHWNSWLPGRGTRWAVAFGTPVRCPDSRQPASVACWLEEMADSLKTLHTEALPHV
jgi:1-acyl-sn-glycerol-3-phosphate acyltransferase